MDIKLPTPFSDELAFAISIISLNVDISFRWVANIDTSHCGNLIDPKP